MEKSPLSGLILRTATVRLPQVGFMIAADPELEEEGTPHAVVARWNAGAWSMGDRNYDAHSACIIEQPSPGLVDIAENGYYSVTTRDGMRSGDILDSPKGPRPDSRRVGGFRSVAAIAGRAYAVGLRGMVYRFDGPTRWSRLDMGVPEGFDGQSIHGFAEGDVYAVGRRGEVWHFDGNAWDACSLPTNRNLTSVHCGGDGLVYVAGHGGLLVRGRADVWEVVEQTTTDEDFWDLQWFQGEMYASTLGGIFVVHEAEVEPIDFGTDQSVSCYQLSAAPGVLWSNGEFDVMSFDGQSWTRVVSTYAG